MPQNIALSRVFLASPSDISEELSIAKVVLEEWNVQHGQAHAARVESVHWRTHTYPQTGLRPQALVNQQAFDQCDIVIAIFWSRLGTRTGRSISGTVEEIRRGIRQNKPVMVYFSRIPLPGSPSPEHSRVDKFKRQFGDKALYWEYSDIGSFERSLRNHLAVTMNVLLNK